MKLNQEEEGDSFIQRPEGKMIQEEIVGEADIAKYRSSVCFQS
jgi:hypothetical protein